MCRDDGHYNFEPEALRFRQLFRARSRFIGNWCLATMERRTEQLGNNPTDGYLRFSSEVAGQSVQKACARISENVHRFAF